ncbi:MAG TPA: hypothetical protein VE092_15270 [Herbaspirillum sp.]|nr:hypothetical protein [Herbaspirillum sp.]
MASPAPARKTRPPTLPHRQPDPFERAATMSIHESGTSPSSAFANPFALNAFGASAPRSSEFADHYARYARESAQLMQQISMKAPQLASVLEQLNEGSAQRRIDLDPQPAGADGAASGGAGLLGNAAGALRKVLQHALPGGRALLQMKLIKNKRQA